MSPFFYPILPGIEKSWTSSKNPFGLYSPSKEKGIKKEKKNNPFSAVCEFLIPGKEKTGKAGQGNST